MTAVKVVMMRTTGVTVETKVETVIEIRSSGEIYSSGPDGGPTSNQPDAVMTNKDEQKEQEEYKASSQKQEAEPVIEEQYAEHWAARRADPRFF